MQELSPPQYPLKVNKALVLNVRLGPAAASASTCGEHANATCLNCTYVTLYYTTILQATAHLILMKTSKKKLG